MAEKNMNIVRKTVCIGALALALSGEGCATITNTITGPPVTAIHFGQILSDNRKKELTKNDGTELFGAVYYPAYIPAVMFRFVAGIPMGMLSGFGADVYFIKNHKYPEGYNPLKYDSWFIKTKDE